MTAPRLGYCTNVHPGTTVPGVLEQLELHACAVRARLGARTLPVGLWLAAPVARRLADRDRAAAFGAWLAERGLEPFTVNAFPYGDFHEPVVKHRVYAPDWSLPPRAAYTRDAALVLAALLPRGGEAGVSTLPIAWGGMLTEDGLARAGLALRRMVDLLDEIRARTDRTIHLDLEPEPGCELQRSDDLVRFVESHVLRSAHGAGEAAIRRHLRVCHDVCHAVVMGESQHDAMAAYARAGLAIGKVQVSSCPIAPLDGGRASPEVRAALGALAEPRYLHQATFHAADGDAPLAFYEDLPPALAALDAGLHPDAVEVRVHFHVPVHLETAGPLRTSRDAVTACLAACADHGTLPDLEVETYAWSVLPGPMQPGTLAEGIATELAWTDAAAAEACW